ncbi:DNA polymerase Y family protein [Rhodoblastus acidophilus]|uniref:DNA polymerase Y family protein n=1 Tax=Candidatus Rhodoblastus alkanivorans TaxID=2954117 RepID=A0ABS9Z8Z3_9HYPH|nr:DNA polymerase Y family protein [Candidatus Rhodoblastus alkanivorans]MCI4680156.1 DNA polymerase Y family protein [Candidatus Rhodoblastus alkanivorans]MCI4684113.1 DNA polymerase Y family protein [Candidatus Rhodoblastus alkanivorans]MDI4641433.1 DNA polymerase Y family protein [Rhodoblastus acidophilus]
MRRYLALFLPFLPTERWRSRQAGGAPDEAAPFALVEKKNNAQRLYALNPAALRQGLAPGLTLADARARLPQLAVAEADRRADHELLLSLAAHCERYTPLTALDEPHGLVLDVTGCAHLFGGEAGLASLTCKDLAALGFSARAALAQTPDCARALACFSEGGVFSPDEAAASAARLPLAALELDDDKLLALSRAGLKTIGDLACRPARAFAARFGADFPHRIERLLGREDVRVTPLRPPPDCMVERHFAEPLAQSESIEAVLMDLIQEAKVFLERRSQGGRLFEASFFRADGFVRRLSVETLQPTRDPKILALLFHEKLDSLADPLDPGFGFDALRLAVPRAENFDSAQGDFAAAETQEAERELGELLDRLTTRFGRARVLRFMQGDAHEPERESRAVPVAAAAAETWSKPRAGEPPARPLTLFDPPQPVEVLALAPDGPPARFRWRRKMHEILRAEGPERIVPDWSVFGMQEPTRDYYRVEDIEGRRFWLFRRGLYERGDDMPRWFLHGLFA